MKKNDECVRLGVEEPPHGVGERLLEGELLGRGEGVAVDAEGLVRKEEPNHKCWSYIYKGELPFNSPKDRNSSWTKVSDLPIGRWQYGATTLTTERIVSGATAAMIEAHA